MRLDRWRTFKKVSATIMSGGGLLRAISSNQIAKPLGYENAGYIWNKFSNFCRASGEKRESDCKARIREIVSGVKDAIRQDPPPSVLAVARRLAFTNTWALWKLAREGIFLPRRGAVHYVRDDSADFGMCVRKSTAVQCVATKVSTKYPIYVPTASIWFFESPREIWAWIVAIRLRSLTQVSVTA